ncbi:hypothetical protein CBL_09492 [Carabus blaptoides fortunei]
MQTNKRVSSSNIVVSGNMRQGLTYTLVFIKNEYQVLLGLKKRGFGKGKWNGFGGKVEKNETIFDGAIRETKEECNLKVNNLKHVGIVAYEDILDCRMDFVHVFTANKYTDILQESDEMKPEWFDYEIIPFQQMWPDAKYWYPFMLQDKNFFAHVVYYNEESYKNTNIREYSSIKMVADYMKSLMKRKNIV